MKTAESQASDASRSNPESMLDPRCRIEMLGSLRVVRPDQTITRFRLQKAAAILSFLALDLKPHSRDQLIDIFWPELDLPAGRDNLSTALAGLRRQLEPPGVPKGAVFLTTHAQVGLNPAVVTTDVAEFERLLGRAEHVDGAPLRVEILEQALDLYRGDFLPDQFYDWSAREMERLQSRRQQALRRLAADYEALGNISAALESAQQCAEADPFSEQSHQHLVRLHLLSGRPSRAREIDRKFTALYQEEFGAAPAPAMRKEIDGLFAELAYSQPGVKARPPAAPIPETGRNPGRASLESRADLPAEVDRSSPTIPVYVSRFFGREPEFAQLARFLLPSKREPPDPEAADTSCRLVSLLGPGGNGKTRLALEFVRRASERYNFWCGFVPLVDLTSSSQIAEQIARVLKVAPSQDQTRLEQIIAFLNKRDSISTPMSLLVLDNLERLQAEDETAGATADTVIGLIQTLLGSCHGLRLLCTSRRRLGIQGEQIVDVAPLAVPDSLQAIFEPHELPDLIRIPSVRLYLDRAQSSRPDFGLTPTNAPAVAALCRQLEGSPLALELAAAWVRMLPPRKMWERLTKGLDIPAGTYSDLPPRHRSLTAALDWSFRLLTVREQRLFTRLSVFHGGWTVEAATEICEEPDAFELLARLSDASLVRAAEDDESSSVRYHFLETVRAFSRQRLAGQGDLEAIRSRHADFFLRFAFDAEGHFRAADQAVWFAVVEADHDNLRTAFDYMLGNANRTMDALRMAGSLTRFWVVRGHWNEGRQHLEAALSRAQDLGDSETRACALNCLGFLSFEQGDFDVARTTIEDGLAMRRRLGERAKIADSLHNLGYFCVQLGDLQTARRCYEESLAVRREMDDSVGIADELHHLGLVAQEEQDLDRALPLYEESLKIRRPLGDLRGIAFTLNNLSNLYYARLEFAEARSLMEESLVLRRELGDVKGTATALQNLGAMVARQGDCIRAAELHIEALKAQRDLGDWIAISFTIEGLATVSVANGDTDRAVRLYAGAHGIRESIGAAHSGDGSREEAIAAIRAKIGESGFEAAWAAGSQMARSDIVAYALGPRS